MTPVGAGTGCNKPASKTACRALERIAEAKDDGAETTVAGASLADLSPEQLPPCVVERASFMASFPISLTKQHPYAERNSTGF